MAEYHKLFVDALNKNNLISTKKSELHKDLIEIEFLSLEKGWIKTYLDKSNAIKFAKTLRTEINKITESEVNNG